MKILKVQISDILKVKINDINDITDIAVLIFASWRLLLISGIVGAVVGLFIALTAQPMYKSSARAFPAELVEANDDSLFGGLSRLPGLNADKFSDSGSFKNLTIMESNEFKWHFIQEEGLIHIFYNEKWDEQKQEWVRPDLSLFSKFKRGVRGFIYDLMGENIVAQKYVQEDALVIFDRMFSIIPDPQTGLVTVSVVYHNPEKAAEWANNFFSTLNAHLSNKAIELANLNLTHLENELQLISHVDMREALLRLLVSEKNKEMLASVKENYAYQVVDHAVAPVYRYSPRRGLIVLLGALAATVLMMFSLVLISTLRPWRLEVKARAEKHEKQL